MCNYAHGLFCRQKRWLVLLDNVDKNLQLENQSFIHNFKRSCLLNSELGYYPL